MDNQLLTISKIFTERLFRIPDYQRGYAWTDKQLKDFWSDIQQLEPGNNHYTGVLTLEDVPNDVYKNWEDDLWIISSKNYQPFYLVDGQQRLTTSIILIQSILERISEEDKLNYTIKTDIQRKFIFDSKDDGISRSYIFGYEKDNPSYEYLKRKIFCEKASSGRIQDTVYTQNLENAKSFFKDLISSFSHIQLETLYTKITQHLLFNIFSITKDVDVCVAFETMNNRGKPLSYLELLKNRLIYLSLKFPEPDFERSKLRRSINDCWKTMYHNLGRNKNNPLDDDTFLLTHYIIYFGDPSKYDYQAQPYRFRRMSRYDYATELLEKKFIHKNVLPDAPKECRIGLSEVYSYVSSLQESIETWYDIHNPFDSKMSNNEKIWIDKLNRLGIEVIRPLLLSFFQNVSSSKFRLNFLKAIERQIFISSLIGGHYYQGTYISPFDINPFVIKQSIHLNKKEITGEKVIREINDSTNSLLNNKRYFSDVRDYFKSVGFYKWPFIRYLLFEYNLYLQEKSKTDRPKIFWPEFNEQNKDFITVEHIYPQQARHKYWLTNFNNLTHSQRKSLRNSLGNLLPLSRPKNSSLSNKPFPEKVDDTDGSVVSFRYGSYAENEVSTYKDWTPDSILDRGLKMLSFVEERWNINLSSDRLKREMLGLSFLKND